MDSVCRAEKEKYQDVGNGQRIKGERFYTEGNQINKMAWAIYEMTDDPEILGRILKWTQELLAYENPAYHDTYAHILYKIGNYDKAIEYQQKAIDFHNSRIAQPNEKLEFELLKMKNREL